LLSKLVKHRPSPSLVISCLALFIALGSAGYAATGGNFILGNPNSATSQTSLTAAVAGGKALQVTNTSTAAGAEGIGITVGANKAPIHVNSNAGKATFLNADKLDGINSTGFLAVAAPAGGDLSGPFGNLQLNASVVTSAEVLDDIAGGGLNDVDLAANSVGSSEIATDAVQATEVANDSIDSGEVVDFGLTNQDVAVEFAQINADGTVANSSGGVTTAKLGTGTYEVDFGHNISNCGFVMTQGEAGVGGAGGAITGVTDRSGNVEAVFATTRTNANALADRAFQLVVVC
jgi:hypothetical protein